MEVAWYNPSTNGSPNRSAITGFDVVFSDSGSPVTLWLQEVSIIPEVSAFPNGVASFSFDDSYSTTYTLGRPCFDKYGFAATAYTIAQETDGAVHRNAVPSITQAQLYNLQTLGWDIAGHAFTSAAHDNRLDTLSASDLDSEMGQLRRWLDLNGYRGGSHFAYPGGVYNAAVEQTTLRYFATARETGTIPKQYPVPSMPGRIKTVNITYPVTLSTIYTEIDRAYTYKTWIVFVLHNLITSGIGWPLRSDLQSIIDYCVTKGIPVRTVDEVTRLWPWS